MTPKDLLSLLDVKPNEDPANEYRCRYARAPVSAGVTEIQLTAAGWAPSSNESMPAHFGAIDRQYSQFE